MSLRDLRLRPGARVDLARFDPADTSALRLTKKKAEKEVELLLPKLEQLQELLYADGRFSVLVVLQGMDTSGKDGTIRHVFDGVNPQGVRVASFRVPTPLESRHDFLWRVHQQTPAKGEIVIFNRSHYEDVLVARVHRLVPTKVWEARYGEINAFEHELSDEGVTILKFFLHISPEEQAQRLRERRDDRTKRWKLSEFDVKERQYLVEVHARVPGGPREDQHPLGSLDGRSLQPPVVPQRGRLGHAGRRTPAPQASLS